MLLSPSVLIVILCMPHAQRSRPIFSTCACEQVTLFTTLPIRLRPMGIAARCLMSRRDGMARPIAAAPRWQARIEFQPMQHANRLHGGQWIGAAGCRS
jgi:hypothetical protein